MPPPPPPPAASTPALTGAPWAGGACILTASGCLPAGLAAWGPRRAERNSSARSGGLDWRCRLAGSLYKALHRSGAARPALQCSANTCSGSPALSARLCGQVIGLSPRRSLSCSGSFCLPPGRHPAQQGRHFMRTGGLPARNPAFSTDPGAPYTDLGAHRAPQRGSPVASQPSGKQLEQAFRGPPAPPAVPASQAPLSARCRRPPSLQQRRRRRHRLDRSCRPSLRCLQWQQVSAAELRCTESRQGGCWKSQRCTTVPSARLLPDCPWHHHSTRPLTSPLPLLQPLRKAPKSWAAPSAATRAAAASAAVRRASARGARPQARRRPCCLMASPRRAGW